MFERTVTNRRFQGINIMAEDKKFKFEKFYTPEFRLSFPALDEPKLGPDGTGEPKYSVRMLIPKDATGKNAELMAKIREGAKQAAISFWGDKIPANVKRPIKNGDEANASGQTFEQEAGMWVMNARTNQKVGCVDEKNRLIDDPKAIREKFYAGAWARATVLIGASKKAGNPAVYLILQNIQFLRDDTPFGGRKKATDEFEPVVFDETTEDFKSQDGDSW